MAILDPPPILLQPLQHHPDRVSHLGEEVKNAATKKMQEINKAKKDIGLLPLVITEEKIGIPLILMKIYPTLFVKEVFYLWEQRKVNISWRFVMLLIPKIEII